MPLQKRQRGPEEEERETENAVSLFFSNHQQKQTERYTTFREIEGDADRENETENDGRRRIEMGRGESERKRRNDLRSRTENGLENERERLNDK